MLSHSHWREELDRLKNQLLDAWSRGDEVVIRDTNIALQKVLAQMPRELHSKLRSGRRRLPTKEPIPYTGTKIDPVRALRLVASGCTYQVVGRLLAREVKRSKPFHPQSVYQAVRKHQQQQKESAPCFVS